MPKSSFESPIHLVSEWHEVFENLYINSLPIDYIETVKIEFSNGSLWEIDISSQISISSNTAKSNILETFKEYQTDISSLNFTVNIDKLKKDISEKTKKIF